MRHAPGTQAPPIQLPAIDGTVFDTAHLAGRPYLLAFFRFAQCPFCNLRLHRLVTQYHTFGAGFTIVAVFDAPLDHLARHAASHHAPFPILADAANTYYRAYGIERSVGGMLKGLVTRLPTMLKSLSMGYVPTALKGSLFTMPAAFLIDPEGIIQTAYYGTDEGDHLPLDAIRAFSQQHERPAPTATGKDR